MLRTLIGFTFIGIAFYVMYRWVLPRFNPFSMVGALLRYAINFTVLMLFLAMVFLSPQMRWSLAWQDWVWNIVFARVTNNPFSAHVFSYVTIPIIYFGALWLTRNEYFSFAYAASTVFLHEFVWYVFTVAFIFRSGIVAQPTFVSSTAFVIMICCFGAVILHVYKFPWKWFLVPLVYTVLFDTVWFWWNGWHVTVSIFDVVGQAQYSATQYYYDFGANMFENVGWLTLFPIMVLSLYFARPHIERLLGRDLTELARHGWIK